MEPSEQQRPPGNGGNRRYGYSGAPTGYGAYPGYGYGYGYGGAEMNMQRTLKDYVLILRERIWYLVLAFLVVFASVLIFTYTRVPIYQSTATVQIFRRE